MSTTRPVSIRTFVAIILGIFGFVALGLWGEHSNYLAHRQRLEANLKQSAEAISQHVDDTIEMADVILAALKAEIEEDWGEVELTAQLRKLMLEQQNKVERLQSLAYVDADGRVVMVSNATELPVIDVADRAYFRYHKTSSSSEAFLGTPIKNRLNGEWVITESLRVNRPDGTFAGVLLANIKLAHYLEFFGKFDVGSKGSILLSKGDGTVLARLPHVEKILGLRMPANDAFFQTLSNGGSGSYHFVSAVDRESRIAGYYRSPITGIIAAASASDSESMTDWLADAQIRWLFGVFMIILALLLAFRWKKQALLRAESEAMVRQRDEEFRLLADASADIIEKLDMDGTRQYVSSAAARILGIEPSTQLGTCVFKELNAEELKLAQDAWQKVSAGESPPPSQFKRVRPDGKTVWLDISLSPINGPGGNVTGVVAITRDVTRQKTMHDELDLLANTDALTGLANRRAFDIRFEALLRQGRDEGTSLSLLMIDADCFKLYNDSYGHSAGDQCLRSISTVTLQSIRSTDIAARYGGEEIAILLSRTTEAQAAMIADKIRKRVEQLDIKHQSNKPWDRATVSIGVASCDGDSLDSSTLFAHADAALYQAKKRGKNRCVLASTLTVSDTLASTA